VAHQDSKMIRQRGLLVFVAIAALVFGVQPGRAPPSSPTLTSQPVLDEADRLNMLAVRLHGEERGEAPTGLDSPAITHDILPHGPANPAQIVPSDGNASTG
jgi:hypothetical protein